MKTLRFAAAALLLAFALPFALFALAFAYGAGVWLTLEVGQEVVRWLELFFGPM